MGSNSDVSAFFRLRFRNGLGTKPAGVLPFRMRVPNTFFLSLAWWLAGFQVLRCAKVCFAWGDFFSLFLVGSKSNVSAVFWLRWASTQKGWSIRETCQPSPNHCFDRPHPTLLSPLLGVGGMGGSPSIIFFSRGINFFSSVKILCSSVIPQGSTRVYIFSLLLSVGHGSFRHLCTISSSSSSRSSSSSSSNNFNASKHLLLKRLWPSHRASLLSRGQFSTNGYR